jgi:hypothetical protein
MATPPTKFLLVAALLAPAAGACSDDGGGGVDLCESNSPATAILGQGVGATFLPYEDLEEVGLAVAPQGGFGVTVIVRTEGLLAGDGLTANVQLNVEADGQLAGEFLQENTVFSCRGKDIGGEVRGVVVGFDPDVYKTNDDLIALDGKVVDLVVTVNSSDGATATVRQPLTIKVGG